MRYYIHLVSFLSLPSVSLWVEPFSVDSLNSVVKVPFVCFVYFVVKE